MGRERGRGALTRALSCVLGVLSFGLPFISPPPASAGNLELPFIRGDINADSGVDISDAVSIIVYILGGDSGPAINCDDAADVNDDDDVDIADPIYLLNHLFAAGAAIPAPNNECGSDGTSPSTLSCDVSPACDGAEPLPTVDDGGWTVFTPSANTQMIYVSSATGDDDNNGLSPDAPKATIAAGYSELRDGYPDWLLLKRGDEWEEDVPDWEKSGESESALMLMSSYGDEGDRPVIMTGDDNAFIIINGNNLPVLSHIALVGLHFYAHTRDPNHPDFSVPSGNISGIFVLHQVDDFLLEDCLIEYYGQGITITGEGSGHTNVRVRRCVILDSYSTDAHAEGAFFAETHGLTIEENIFDHNGWNEEVTGAVPNIFRHSIYVYGNCSDVAARKNIILRSASHGAQLRTGGVFDDNLLIQNSIGIAFWDSGTVHGNVILESKDISASLPRAVGIWIQEANSDGISVDHNIIANDIGAEWGQAITARSEIGAGIDTLVIDNNTVCAHKVALEMRGFTFSDMTVNDNIFQSPDDDTPLVDTQEVLNPTDYTFDNNVYYSSAPTSEWFSMEWIYYPFSEWESLCGEVDPLDLEVDFEDPTRDVADYQESIGGIASEAAFFTELRLQAKHYWRAEYSITNLLDYFRAGFVPVTDLGVNPPGAVAPAP